PGVHFAVELFAQTLVRQIHSTAPRVDEHAVLDDLTADATLPPRDASIDAQARFDPGVALVGIADDAVLHHGFTHRLTAHAVVAGVVYALAEVAFVFRYALSIVGVSGAIPLFHLF